MYSPHPCWPGSKTRYLNGSSIARYFDLITGTSTGGIIALGLGAGLKAAELRDLYWLGGGKSFRRATHYPGVCGAHPAFSSTATTAPR